MIRTVVMIHPGGLGDVLLAVPAMIRLRARFPDHRLVLCAGDQVAMLLLACGVIDDWISVSGRACTDLFAGVGSVTGQLRSWLERCDLAVGWMEDRGGRLGGALKASGARAVTVRSPFSPAIRAPHQRDRFLETIDEAQSGNEGAVRLTISKQLLLRGRASLEAAGFSVGLPLAVVHPGSGSLHKCAAPEVLAPVIAALKIAGAIPTILEGPADRTPVKRLLSSCVKPPIVLKELDILAVAGVLAQAELFVGQDSGITHLAGLMGVRTVALFGPTDPARWAPRGADVTVVQGAPCLCRSWDEVSRCQGKPCLKIPQDHLANLCLAHF